MPEVAVVEGVMEAAAEETGAGDSAVVANQAVVAEKEAVAMAMVEEAMAKEEVAMAMVEEEKGEAESQGVVEKAMVEEAKEGVAMVEVAMVEGEKREVVERAKEAVVMAKVEAAEGARPQQAGRQAPKALQVDHQDRLRPKMESSNSYRE